jgi:molybdenum cofactor guanylyltransferase
MERLLKPGSLFYFRHPAALIIFGTMAEQIIYGLVVCGGKSNRMGMDKYQLNYHGLPQYQHVCQLLKICCDQVFISCNQEQAEVLKAQQIPLIPDLPQYKHSGPVAALLSASTAYPGKDWLVMGCDYPFITEAEINTLVSNGQSAIMAAAFYHTQSCFYEPLLALYKTACFPSIEEDHRQQQYSLQHFLKHNQATKCYASDEYRLQSIDTSEAYEVALKQIRESL